LKQVMVRAIDQGDCRRSLLESLGGGQSAKATANYNDSRLSHLLLNFLQSFLSNIYAGEECNPFAIRKIVEKQKKAIARFAGGVWQMTNCEQEARTKFPLWEYTNRTYVRRSRIKRGIVEP